MSQIAPLEPGPPSPFRCGSSPWSRTRVSTAWNHVEAVKSSFRRGPHDSTRLPPPFAAEHALLECRRVPIPVAAVAGLAVAKIEVGIKDGIAARLSVGTHQVVIRVVVMVGLRGESPYEDQSASGDGALHSVLLGSDGLGLNFLGTTPPRSSCRPRGGFIKGGWFGSGSTVRRCGRHVRSSPDRFRMLLGRSLALGGLIAAVGPSSTTTSRRYVVIPDVAE
jgi:hypothetical protein